MAKRLIDANSFVIEELLDRDKTEYLDTFVDGVRATMKAIRTAPTEDSVDVISCHNCQHWMQEAEDIGLCVVDAPDIYGVERHKNDFCSYGERRCEDG